MTTNHSKRKVLLTFESTFFLQINNNNNNKMRVSLALSLVLLLAAPSFGVSASPANNIDNRNNNSVLENEGLVRRFFRWLGWARPPIFGFTTYNHLDLGAPGEVRNDVEFRLGPKPNYFFDTAALQQQQQQLHPSYVEVEPAVPLVARRRRSVRSVWH